MCTRIVLNSTVSQSDSTPDIIVHVSTGAQNMNTCFVEWKQEGVVDRYLPSPASRGSCDSYHV